MKQKTLGVLLCALVAGTATALSGVSIGTFSVEIIGAPVLSILIGMVLSMLCPGLGGKAVLKDGIKFTSKKILQWAVIILGFSLNLRTIADMGSRSLPIIISTIGISLLTAFIMMKLLKINGKTACLIGVGSSICGGSAIAATAPVIDADDENVAQAVSVIFLFNVIAAIVFPGFGRALGLGSEGFAVFAGTAVNDTSSVTAVASTAEELYGVEGILSAAVTVKLVRTLAIIPVTLILALYTTYKAKKDGTEAEISFTQIFPWFILFFVGAAVLTTIVGVMPDRSFTVYYNEIFVKFMKWLAKFFITMSMCAIGLNTNIVRLIKNGGKPITMGFCCWIAITLVSIYMQYELGMFYSEI